MFETWNSRMLKDSLMATLHRIGIAIALLSCTSIAFAQIPANDDCVGAISVGLGLTPFDSRNATNGSGLPLDPMVCDMGPSGTEQLFQDLWFEFTPAASTNYDIAIVNNGNIPFDSRLAIYAQSTCPDDPATVVGCDDDHGPGVEAAVTVLPLVGGVTYLIRGGSYSNTTTERVAMLSISTTSPPPANDSCSGAVVANVGVTPFDTTLSTLDGQDLIPGVCDFDATPDETVYNDVWFSFTAPTTDSYDFDTDNGTLIDTRIAIYDQSTCPDDPLQVIACSDDDIGAQSLAQANLTMGSTYLVRVGSDDPVDRGAGNLTIGITPPPPANDDCVNAQAVGLGLTPYDTTHATDGTGLPLDAFVCNMGPAGDEQLYQDVWFTFSPPNTGYYDITSVNGANPLFDSRLAVYDQPGCPDDPLNVIACDDDSGFSLTAEVEGVAMTMGVTYLIRLGSFQALTTEYPSSLSISVGTMPPPPPANNRCPDAQVLPGYGTYAFDTTNASTNGFPLTGFCSIAAFGNDDIQQDVWFEFTPTVTDCVYISTLGLAGFDTRLAVYGSTACPEDPASVLACSDDENWPASFEAGLDVWLTAGQTVLIRLGSWDFTSAGGAGSIRIAQGPVAVDSDMGTQPGAPGCIIDYVFIESCHGDGGDQMGCTNCPCSNNAPVGTIGGCLNSAGLASRLVAAGDTSVSLPPGSNQDLWFAITGVPSNAFCILNSGDALAPGNPANPCFALKTGTQALAFDGLRCAITNSRRHGGRAADANGEVGVTNSPWGGAGGPPAGIANAGGGFVAGQTRYFQAINRDDTLLSCMRGLNTSQAIEITFLP